METIFKQLGDLSRLPLEVKNRKQDHIGLEVTFFVDVVKGCFTQRLKWWGNVCESYLEGYYSVEVVDWESEGAFIDGVSIDNLGNFIGMLNQSGLSSVADALTLDSTQLTSVFENSIEGSAAIECIFPGQKSISSLSLEEKKKAVIKQHLEKGNIPDWALRRLELEGLSTEDMVNLLKTL